MKYYKSKTARFLNSKGFYLAMAICMIAIGFAAYSAMDAIRLEDTTKQPSVSESAPDITPNPQADTEQQPQIIQTEESKEELTAEVDGETVAEYFSAPVEGTVSKGFDQITLQYSATYNDFRLHTAADIIPLDSYVVNSCSNGRVASVDTDTILGTVITIDHGNGIYIRYCGLKNVKVKAGDIVDATTVIAEIGTVTNECAEEAHLHIEVIKDGTAVDPTSIIPLS